jgi:hypothetical protein
MGDHPGQRGRGGPEDREMGEALDEGPPARAAAELQRAHADPVDLAQRLGGGAAGSRAARAGTRFDVFGEGVQRHGRALGVAAQVEHDVTRQVQQHHAARLGGVQQGQPLALRGLGRDVHGEHAGDTLLRAVARQLQAETPEHLEHELRAVAPAVHAPPPIGCPQIPERLVQKGVACQRAGGGYERVGVGGLDRRIGEPLGRAEQQRAGAGRGDPQPRGQRKGPTAAGHAGADLPGGHGEVGAGQPGDGSGVQGAGQRRVLGHEPQCRAGAHQQEPPRPPRDDPHRLLGGQRAAQIAIERRVGRHRIQARRRGAAAQRHGREGHSNLVQRGARRGLGEERRRR